MNNYSDLSLKDLTNEFFNACKDGQLNVIQYLLTSNELKEKVNIHSNTDFGFRIACQNGQLEVIKYLVSSSEITQHSDINVLNNAAFKSVCEKNKLDVLLYLESINQNSEYKNLYVDGFKGACQNSSMDIITYLIGSTALKDCLATSIEEGFRVACLCGKLDVVQFLSSTPEFKNNKNNKNNKNRQMDNERCFNLTCMNGHIEVADYFLSNLNLKVTPDMKDTLKKGLRKEKDKLNEILRIINYRDTFGYSVETKYLHAEKTTLRM